MIPGLAVLSNTSVESDPNTTMTTKGTPRRRRVTRSRRLPICVDPHDRGVERFGLHRSHAIASPRKRVVVAPPTQTLPTSSTVMAMSPVRPSLRPWATR